MSDQAAIRIFDSHVTFMEASEFERSEEDIPHTVVDLFKADIFSGAADADIDPGVIPADTAVGADVAKLEAIGILRRYPEIE